MIDTFMVLWNRDRKRKGLKLFLTFLLIGGSALLLLATFYLPSLIFFPKREYYAPAFSSKTIATATVQEDQTNVAQKASLTERARVIEATPGAATQICTASVAGTTNTPAKILSDPQKHAKHLATRKKVKKTKTSHQLHRSKSSTHRLTKKTHPVKIIAPPATSLRPTKLAIKPTVTLTPGKSVTPVRTAIATPGSVATASTKSVIRDSGDKNSVIATVTATTGATIQQRSEKAAIPLLRLSGGPISDDTSSSTQDDTSDSTITPRTAVQGTQPLILSCVQRRSPTG